MLFENNRNKKKNKNCLDVIVDSFEYFLSFISQEEFLVYGRVGGNGVYSISNHWNNFFTLAIN